MMRTKVISAALFIAIISSAILLLRIAYPIPASGVAATIAASPVPATATERSKDSIEPGAPDPTEPVGSDTDLMTDGPALIASHCTKCHVAQSFSQIKKQRDEWELTLVRMEKLGVHMSEREKSVLLDYLVLTTDP